ncbi:MAG: Cof-type HAD-IIB family hydrolase [Eubacteriales bacterium]|nr:Cof-type HAD-IIB family hydrolase [Eubacteriales bacterium]
MNYKLLVLDIDGTATNSQKQVTPKTRDAVIRLLKAGVPVAIASGRPTPGVAPIAEEFDFGAYGSYALCFNGAKIINWKTKELVYSKTLPASIPRRVFEDACKYDVGILTYAEGDSAILAGRRPDQYTEKEAQICSIPIIDCKDRFVRHITHPVTKCLITGDPDILECIEPVIADKYRFEANVFRSEPYFLEIMPQNVDKAYCLSKLLKILGIKREEMVCCGDGFNDLTMIQYAGMGVAMANAQQAVKDVADFITLSNDEDGVEYVIRKFWPELF